MQVVMECIYKMSHMYPLNSYPVWVMVPALVSIVISRPGLITPWLKEYCKDWPAVSEIELAIRTMMNEE